RIIPSDLTCFLCIGTSSMRCGWWCSPWFTSSGVEVKQHMNPITELQETRSSPEIVHLPAPTTWPIVLAFGITLMFTGLLTNPSVSLLGVALTMAGCVGWFRDVLPEQKEEAVEIQEEPTIVTTVRREVERLPVAPELSRPLLPLETYPVS